MELFSPPREKFLEFQETKTPKKFLRFSQKEAFLIFRGTETSKNPYLSGNGTFLVFQERNIQNPDITELFLYFRKVVFRTLA